MNSALRNDPFLAPDLRHRWDWSTWSPFIPPYFLFYRNVFESHATPRYGKQTSDISSFSSSSDFRIFSKLWKREGKDEPMMATIPTRQLYFFSSSFPIEEEEERTNLFQQDSIHLLSNNFRVARYGKQISDISSFSSSSNIRIFSKLWIVLINE